MTFNESNKHDKIEQNTPIFQYPKLINGNFANIENVISFFYNQKNKTFTDKKSGNVIIAPVYNEKVESNVGIFDDITVDNLKVLESILISNKNGQEVNLDSIVLKEFLDRSNFIIDDVTGVISIRKSEEESIICPIEADTNGNVVIGVEASLPTSASCIDNIGIGDNLTLSNIGKVDNKTDNNSYNIAIGAESLSNLLEGSGNIVYGATSCVNMSTGSGNIILGTGICNNISSAHNKLYIGNFNTGIFIEGDMSTGVLALHNPSALIKFDKDIQLSSTEASNIILGYNTMNNINYLTGGDNILIGTDISSTIMGGNKNIFIGSNSAYRLFDIPNYNLCIGVVDENVGISEPIISADMKAKYLSFNSIVTEFKGDIKVSNDFRTSGAGTAIGLDVNNNIVKFTSSKRYKTSIKSVKKEDSKKIYNIECVTYEPIVKDGNEYFGFIAEDVASVDKRLVGYTNIDGVATVDSVLYERFVVLLLNELKDHEQTINELKLKVEQLSNKN